MYGRANMVVMRGFRMDPSITRQKLKPGTIRRIAAYARPYRMHLAVFLLATAVDAVITVVNPLLLRDIIDHGILGRDEQLVILLACAVAVVAIFDAALGFVIRWFSARNHGILGRDEQLVILLACAVAVVAIFDAALGFVIRWFSARIGEGLIYDLRTQVFDHVQRQPIAFFTRAQTGSLVSRLDGDVVGAQQAITSTLSGVLSNLLSLVVILIALFYLSWQVTVIALVMIPLFILPARLVGRRLQRLTRESMQLDAEMGSTMTERFNVAGAMLVKLFGHPANEARVFAGRAAGVRDLEPLIAERPDAVALPWSGQGNGSGPTAALPVEFDDVSFRYPTASEVSLASKESIARPAPARNDTGAGVLHEVSFRPKVSAQMAPARRRRRRDPARIA